MNLKTLSDIFDKISWVSLESRDFLETSTYCNFTNYKFSILVLTLEIPRGSIYVC